MNKSLVELVRQTTPLWCAEVVWTQGLILRTFNLEHADDILNKENSGTQCGITHHSIGTC